MRKGVQSLKIPSSEGHAAAQLAESISLKAKGVDSKYTSNFGRTALGRARNDGGRLVVLSNDMYSI